MQPSKQRSKALREAEISAAITEETAEKDVLMAILYAETLDLVHDSPQEKIAYNRLDGAIEETLGNTKEALEIMDLSGDWHSAGLEYGFKTGFRTAVRIMSAGMLGN